MLFRSTPPAAPLTGWRQERGTPSLSEVFATVAVPGPDGLAFLPLSAVLRAWSV